MPTSEGGKIGAAAGRQANAVERFRIERKVRQHDCAGRRIDHLAQRVTNDRRVFVQFLFHEVAVVALADSRARHRGAADLALHFGPVHGEETSAIARDHRPIAVIEEGDALGQWRQSQRIAAKEHFIVAVTHSKRRAKLSTDHHFRMTCEDHG